MWAWLAFPVLARVLMASQEADQFGPKSTLHSDIVMEEDVGDGELLRDKIKPVSKSQEVEWRQDPRSSTYDNSVSNLIRDLSSSGQKVFPNKPDEHEEERNKRSSMIGTRDREPTEAWMSWISLENKALRSRTRQDPWKEIKKSRAFSPWGGKRVSALGQGAKVRRPIRVPFNSWGGKRGFPDSENRASFSSWGGKRGWNIVPEENYVENSAEKRTKFNAWGGKRSKNVENDDEEVKRTRFNAWGGKRSFKNEKRMPEEVEAKKSTFNAWGGKRSFTSIEAADKWEGKEGDESHPDNPAEMIEIEGVNNTDDIEEGADGDDIRLAESDIIEFPKKKVPGVDYGHKNLLFNPWGGKKRSQTYDELRTNFYSILPSSNDLQGHQLNGRFWPWGG